MFHTAARPAGVYLNNASCTAASLLDRDVFVFSRLSLWSSSIEEEKKLECGTGVVFISNKNLSFDLTQRCQWGRLLRRDNYRSQSKCANKMEEKKTNIFLDLKIFSCSSLYFLCLNVS